MQRYVIIENIRRFREQLGAETAAERRKVIEDLLKSEEAKLAVLDAAPSPRKPDQA